jgi:hypothetical protein
MVNAYIHSFGMSESVEFVGVRIRAQAKRQCGGVKVTEVAELRRSREFE